MPLVNRWYQILQLFLNRRTLSLEEIKVATNTSTQTIKKTIELLNEQLLDIAMIQVKNNQYQIEIQDYEVFEDILSGSLKEESDFNSPSKRIAYMLKELLTNKEYSLIDDFSEKLGVSRGTVNKDLKSLKAIIEEYHVTLEGTPNRGLKLVGKEFEFRLLYLNHVFDYYPPNVLLPESLSAVLDFAEKISLENRLVILWRKVIRLSIGRIQNGFYLAEPIPAYNNHCERTAEMEDIFTQIELNYGLSISQLDFEFMVFPLNSYQFIDDVKDEKILKKIFKQMIAKIQETVFVEMDEADIYEEVKQHLYFLVYRLNFYQLSPDLFQNEIERNYPFAYQLASIGISALEHILDRKAPTAEISYFAIYFELYFKNNQTAVNKKVAFVSNTGKATTALIHRQIVDVTGPQIEVIDYTERDFIQVNQNDFFAVFSMTKVSSNVTSPIVYLNGMVQQTLLREEWQRVLQENHARFNFLDLSFKAFQQVDSYERVLNDLLDELVQLQMVDADFPRRVLEREEKSSTVFSHGVAFPHAVLVESERILFCLGVLPEPILTAAGEVDLIFLVGIPEKITACNEEELLQMYDAIFTVATQEENREDILQLSNYTDFVDFFRRKEIFI